MMQEGVENILSYENVLLYPDCNNLRPAALLKKTLLRRCFPEFFKISKNTFCDRAPSAAASERCY